MVWISYLHFVKVVYNALSTLYDCHFEFQNIEAVFNATEVQVQPLVKNVI